jgi:NTP pyrophosphatase (non-canonical NTP hydrolase)
MKKTQLKPGTGGEAKMTERNNTCVACGAIIPEGRQVCMMCEGKLLVNYITMTEYQRLAARTSNTTGEDKICNGCLGLAGECGEVIDLYKKHRYQGHELDYSKMVEELGDELWYVAEITSGLDISLGAIARRNIDKLSQRYPDGFVAERSINREGNT